MIKKLLTYSLVITTMVWSVGLLATPLAVGAAVSGDLIKLQCAAGAEVNAPCKAVYYLGADSKRYVFPNEKTYKTWYSDFSGVQIVSDTEMSSYSIGGNATYKPGVKLVKITTDPKVYAVAADGTLMWVTTGDIAEAIYGAGWASMVEDVPDAFFVNYTVGSDIAAAGDFDKDAQTSAASSINDDKNLGGDTLGGISTGTGLTVALASDTPASGVVLGNTINNKFTKVNLTASSDGDIVIDQITVKRGGTIASDAAFSSIALIDAATMKRIGNTKSVNSQHQAVFNKDITVAAGTTKTLYLVGNMGALALYAGEYPSLDLAGITLTGSAAVIGTLPIVGNYQVTNGTITVGALTVANGTDNPTASTQKIGTTNYIVSGVKLTANSVEDFKVTQINFNQGGTASNDDIGNVDLIIDDVVVGTVLSPDDGDVFFDLSANPVTIEKGKSVQVNLQLDIFDGSDRTIRFDIKDESDVVAMGQTYGSEVKVAAGSGATADAEPFWTAQSHLVARGTLRIGPATLTNANIPEDSTQVVLGKFEFDAKGEGVEITSLPVVFTIATSSAAALFDDSTVDLTNVTVYDENGIIVAGPDDPTQTSMDAGAAVLTTTLTDTISVPAGLHIYTVKADIDSDFGSGDTIIVSIDPDASTVKGSTTGLTITPTPASAQSSATMTVQSAALAISVSPLPVAQTVVAGTVDYTFANVILGAESAGEDVKVTKVKVNIITTGTAQPAETSNWSLFDGDTELAVTNDPDSDASSKTSNLDSATATFTFTTPLVITKGTSKTLTVKANITNSADSGTISVGMQSPTGADHVTAKGNDSGLAATITVSASDGQAMTITETGELTISIDASTPKVGLIPASTNGITMAVFNAFARYEDINVEKIYLTAPDYNTGGLDQVSTVYVYKGNDLVATVVPTSTDNTADKTVLIDITNNPIVVPKDASIKLTIKVDTSAANYELGSIGASGQGLAFSFNAAGDITAKGAKSGDTVTTKSVTGAASNAQYLFKSVPTLATNNLLSASDKVAGGILSNGTEANKALYAFSVTADSSGDIGLHNVSFYITTNTATITSMYISDGTNYAAYQPTGALTFSLGSAETLGTDSWTGVAPFYFVNDQIAPTAYNTGSNVVPYTISAGETKIFTLHGDVQCTIIGGSVCSGSSGSGSINIQMLGDTQIPDTMPDTSGNLTGTEVKVFSNSFVWSDFWRTSILGTSSTTASNTEQWSNGYGVALTNGGKMTNTSTAAIFSK